MSVDRKALAEASAWFARLRSPSVDAETLRDFYAWREGTENRAAYEAVEGLWRRGEGLAQDPEILIAAADARRRGDQRAASRSANGLWRPALAAGLGGIFLVGLALLWLGRDPTFATGVGERREIHLGEGSTIELDTKSQIRVRLDGKTRGIELLRGQAFFEVAHDPQRPFIVSAGATQVRALGTRFDVRREAAGARVTLVQGKVLVSEQAQTSTAQWVLSPGEQVVTGEASRRPAHVDTDLATSWRSGRLVFRGLEIADAIAEANRYSRRQIRLEPGEATAGMKVSGVFDAGDVDALASAVAELCDLDPQNQLNGDILLRSPAQ